MAQQDFDTWKRQSRFYHRRIVRRESAATPQSSIELRPSDLNDIVDFLESPTREGYWALTGTWRYDGTFTRFAFSQLAPPIAANEAPAEEPVAVGSANEGFEDTMEEIGSRV